MKYAAVLFALATASFPASAEIPSLWRVQLQARSASTVTPFNLPNGASLINQSPAISEDGHAAIHFTVPSTSGVEGIFVGKDGSGSTPVLISSGVGLSPSDLDFAFGLLAAVSQGNPSNVTLFDSINGAPQRTFGSPNPNDIVSYSRPRILPGGTSIGYRGSTALGVHKWIIDSMSGDRTQSLMLSDGPGTDYSFLYPPTTNTLGHMGGKVDDADGNSRIIRVDSASTLITVFEGGTDVDFIAGGTDMNDQDQLAFFARYMIGSTPRFSLLRSDGVTTTTIAIAGDLGIQSEGMAIAPPAINRAGMVAFRARDAAGEALFIGDGSQLIRIIGEGDSISTDLGTLPVGFNDKGLSGTLDINSRGEIAFSAWLFNGSVGFFTAKPCYSDFNRDNIVDFFDYLDFLNEFAANQSSADYNHDGGVDFFDYLDFLQDFSTGC